MYTVGHITYVEFLRELARPHMSENVAAHFTVEPRHAVHLLRDVGCED